jgi:hypothetical protein
MKMKELPSMPNHKLSKNACRENSIRSADHDVAKKP